MNDEWTPYLDKIPASAPLLWIIDIQAEAFVDMTPATARFMQTHDLLALPRTLSIGQHMDAARRVVETGEHCALMEWVKFDGSWHKLIRTKSHVGGPRVLEVAADVTHLDPRAEWLARINLDSQRLELGNGGSFSYDEFLVLHLLVKGLQHKWIAETLNISPKTVEYRISRLKDALEAETTTELMLQVTSSGLIHLATVEFEIKDPAMTEAELYRRMPG